MVKPYAPYEGPIISRAEARALGLTRFFPGSRCRRMGHLSQRMVSNGGCAACLAIISERQRKSNPEKAAAAVRASEAKHRDRKLARGRAYSKAHQAESAAAKRRRRAERLAAKLASRIPDPADYTGPVITRVQARTTNLTRFFTGKPCVKNHLSERTTANGGCIACNADFIRAIEKAFGTASHTKRKDGKRVVKHRRRSIESKAEGEFTTADVQRIGDSQKWRCHWCGKPTKKNYHVDHLVPLSKGGTNWPRNLVIACPTCNVRKNAIDPIEYARRIGRLI